MNCMSLNDNMKYADYIFEEKAKLCNVIEKQKQLYYHRKEVFY